MRRRPPLLSPEPAIFCADSRAGLRSRRYFKAHHQSAADSEEAEGKDDEGEGVEEENALEME